MLRRQDAFPKRKSPVISDEAFLVAETGLELASASGGYELPATQRAIAGFLF